MCWLSDRSIALWLAALMTWAAPAWSANLDQMQKWAGAMYAHASRLGVYADHCATERPASEERLFAAWTRWKERNQPDLKKVMRIVGARTQESGGAEAVEALMAEIAISQRYSVENASSIVTKLEKQGFTCGRLARHLDNGEHDLRARFSEAFAEIEG